MSEKKRETVKEREKEREGERRGEYDENREGKEKFLKNRCLKNCMPTMNVNTL